MSYDDYNDGGLTPLEHAAGVWDLLYGNDNGECSCGECEECEQRQNTINASITIKQKKEFENSLRFKTAAKLVAGLRKNREIKIALIQKIHRDSIDTAIVRYMVKEALPDYYAAILKSSSCIERLVEGLFYRVCKLKASQILTEQIGSLSSSLRNNPNQLTAYDRVTIMQQFIHHTVDQNCGVGANRSIPVLPMKNAMSAVRLHLGIFDIVDRGPGYISYIDSLSTAKMQLEYDEPRQSTAPFGKQSWLRWRVRHMRPISYYFPETHRMSLKALDNLDEKISSDQFVEEALLIYAGAFDI